MKVDDMKFKDSKDFTVDKLNLVRCKKCDTVQKRCKCKLYYPDDYECKWCDK